MPLDKIVPLHPSWDKIEFNSSLLKEGAYDPNRKELYIMFHNQSVYVYSPVDKNKFDTMKASPSAGSYFIKHIKTNKQIKYRKYE